MTMYKKVCLIDIRNEFKSIYWDYIPIHEKDNDLWKIHSKLNVKQKKMVLKWFDFK